MLKQFDIDYDKITIDGQVFEKPSYISFSEWLSFWDFPSSVEYEEALDKAYQEGLEENESEHEQELEDLENQFYKELNKLEDRIEFILSETGYSLSDRDFFIKKEFDRIRDIEWL